MFARICITLIVATKNFTLNLENKLRSVLNFILRHLPRGKIQDFELLLIKSQGARFQKFPDKLRTESFACYLRAILIILLLNSLAS